MGTMPFQLNSDVLFGQLRVESLCSQFECVPELGNISTLLDRGQLLRGEID